MEHYDAQGNGVGGGEILDFWGKSKFKQNYSNPYLNNDWLKQLDALPWLKIAVIVMLLLIMVILILKIMNIRTIRKRKGVALTLGYNDVIRRNEKRIYTKTRRLNKLTALVNRSPFKLNKNDIEYYDYMLRRAGVKAPGGNRTLAADEFNAQSVAYSAIAVAIGVFILIFVNYFAGFIIVIGAVVIGSTVPMMIIRANVKEKDREISENFSDFYLMLHYVILANSSTPLESVIKSYAKTTDSEEMKKLSDSCIHYMSTYGEYEGTRYIAKDYREIPSMVKLMRLIRQALSGGEVEQELMGFRTELLNEKRFAMQQRTDKLIAKARASFFIIYIVLFQAILSAMSIYFSDMSMITMFTS